MGLLKEQGKKVVDTSEASVSNTDEIYHCFVWTKFFKKSTFWLLGSN